MFPRCAPDKVISYALFGADRFYRRHLPALLRAHHTLFPDWQLRIHHDAALDTGYYGPALRALAALGLVRLECVSDRTPPLTLGMLWRMRPCWESGVRYNLCRDIDALPTPRERRAVEVFTRSAAAVHCINDHPLHSSLMMGGLVGFFAPAFTRESGLTNFDELVALGGGATCEAWKTKGYDQVVLSEKLWPRVQHAACVHRLSTPRSWPRVEPVAAFYRAVEQLELSDVPPEIQAKADRLAPFIGVDGYEVEPAVTFFSEVMDPQVLDAILSCEAGERGMTNRDIADE